MLKTDLELVRAHARIIAKEEIVAMPRPDDSMEKLEALIKKRIKEAVAPLERTIERLERSLRPPTTVSKDKKGR